MQGNPESGEGIGAEDLGVGPEYGVTGERPRIETQADLPGVEVLGVQSVVH